MGCFPGGFFQVSAVISIYAHYEHKGGVKKRRHLAELYCSRSSHYMGDAGLIVNMKQYFV